MDGKELVDALKGAAADSIAEGRFDMAALLMAGIAYIEMLEHQANNQFVITEDALDRAVWGADE
jgi:hypothetical protein